MTEKGVDAPIFDTQGRYTRIKNEKNRTETEQFFSRWKTEYDFKTFVTASFSLAVTVFFALYNGFLGIRHASLWHGAICVYYILLVLLRGLIIAAAKKISSRRKNERAEKKVYLTASFLLLLLNLSLILPLSMMVRQQKPVNLTLIPAIAIAAYTTYKVAMASVNLKKRRKTSSGFVWLLRTINFIEALVSILTLQNTLIMVHSKGEDIGMLPLTAMTSAAVWIAALVLSIAAIMKGIHGEFHPRC